MQDQIERFKTRSCELCRHGPVWHQINACDKCWLDLMKFLDGLKTPRNITDILRGEEEEEK